MSDLRISAQQALEALKMMRDKYEEYACPACDHADAAIYALKESLVEDAMQKFTDVNQELEAALADGDRVSPGEPVAMDWLHKWANQDDGEPETQWHEGYEAARRVVQIHLTATPQRPAEPAQEQPICDECGKSKSDGWALYCVKCVEPMFAPPQRKPLTDEVIADLWHQNGGFHHHFARAIERWLKGTP